MPINKTLMRKQLQVRAGLSERQAKNAVASMARRLEFQEIAVLFAGDDTALVAVLREAGYDVAPRYAQAKVRVA